MSSQSLWSRVRCVLIEAALVAVVGLVLALAANAVSPRGLRLTRNYFPAAADNRGVPAQDFASPSLSPPEGATNRLKPGLQTGPASDPIEATLQRLQQHGLQTLRSNEVAALHQSPQFEQGLYVFIDARDDSHYQAGHIPRAWQFDHYHAEQYLPNLLPVCLNAQKILVYCKGGACEDSEFAAIMLRDAGIPASNLFVYAGGIGEWMASGRPVETGSRGSGQLVKPKL